jgi:hypothetical protein
MEITAFESAFRAITGDIPGRPLLATPGAGIKIDVCLPAEFQAAARTLAERSGSPGKHNSILGAAAQWT